MLSLTSASHCENFASIRQRDKHCLRVLCLVASLTVSALAHPQSRGVDNRENFLDKLSLTTFVELRDRAVVRQRRDYSCGAAALATLLVHQWGDPVDEEDLLETLSRVLPKEELIGRRTDGLTLLDLTRVARARGYRAQGFQLTPELLAGLDGAVIVFVNPDGYEHFSVLKGIVGGRAYLADPSFGNVTYPLYRFLDMWLGDDGTGIVLAIASLRSDASALPVGALAPPAERTTDAALANIRSHLPFSTLDVRARLPTR